MCCQVKLVELVPSNTQRRFIKIEQQVEMKAQHKLTYASKQLREETDLSLEHGKREIFMTGLRYLLPKIYGALNYHAYSSYSEIQLFHSLLTPSKRKFRPGSSILVYLLLYSILLTVYTFPWKLDMPKLVKG